MTTTDVVRAGRRPAADANPSPAAPTDAVRYPVAAAGRSGVAAGSSVPV